MADSPRSGTSSALRSAPMMIGLQGLISQTETRVERKLQTICKTAKTLEDTAEKSMSAMADVSDSNRRVLVHRDNAERKFVERADNLTRSLASLRERSNVLQGKLKDLIVRAEEQAEELYRTEVDVDMKLRTCRGTCRGTCWGTCQETCRGTTCQFSVDHHGYETLQTDLDFLDRTVGRRNKTAAPNVPRVKLKPVDVGLVPPVGYRTVPAVRRELLTRFEDVGLNRLVLELNGSALSSAEPEQNAPTDD